MRLSETVVWAHRNYEISLISVNLLMEKSKIDLNHNLFFEIDVGFISCVARISIAILAYITYLVNAFRIDFESVFSNNVAIDELNSSIQRPKTKKKKPHFRIKLVR